MRQERCNISHSFTAGGNIPPSRFVSQSTTLDRTVVVSGAGDATVIGISQLGTHLTPLLSLDDGYAAVAGENVQVYTPPDIEAWLELGGTVAAGDFLKPSTAGVGITASSDGDVYGAKALTAGVSGQIVKVKPMIGFRGA